MTITLFTNQKGLLEELNLPFELDHKPLLHSFIILAIPISLQRRLCFRSGVVQQSQKKRKKKKKKKKNTASGFFFYFHISAIPAH